MIAALELDFRVTRAGQAVAYLVANVPIALLALLAIAALLLGAALSVAAVGLPLLIAAAAACRRLARLDRRVANRLLGTQIPPLPSRRRRTARGWWERVLELLGDRELWRTVALLAVKAPLIAALLVVAAVPMAIFAVLLQLGVQGVGGPGGVDYVGPWRLGPGLGIALWALALAAAVLVVATLDALHSLLCTVARATLAPRAADRTGPVREILAESLGDRSISLAYWLPDREAFVDEAGRPVTLPDPGSGRAWTAVERDGRRVAAIVHDPALDTTRELVHAAAASSSLAIDNERLKADLRARLEELRESRRRIVAATDESRRRIERDLHDGAQQQLVALALDLRLLRARTEDAELAEGIDALSERLTVALAELRELARGIHPAILVERGLEPAVTALAERLPVPVEHRVALEERPPPEIESAVYFLVSEALTNTAKYARAQHASVDVRRDGGEVVVRIVDDGIGGARLDRGSGLRGLVDRLAAVDGTLTVDSPVGEGTRIEGRLPLEGGA